MGERTENVVPGDLMRTLGILLRTIESRKTADPENSYTARLLTGSDDQVIKKLTEEAFEMAMAIKDRDHDHIRYEAADLLYHFLVVISKVGISPEELAGELDARM